MSIRTRNIKRFWHSSSSQYSKAQVTSFVNRYGTGILIGGDPGWDEFENTMDAVDSVGALKHVYLVGPGMMSWSEEERQEIMRNARSVGIDTSSSSWQKQWFADKGGWEKKCREWFKSYDSKGFYSAEIDNLDGVWDQDADKYIAFLKRFGKFFKDNNLSIKLMTKNLSEEQLEAMIEDQDWDRDMLAAFGMYEAGSGSPKRQIELCKQLGITAVTPINGLNDTHNYSTVSAGIPAFED